MNLSIFLSDYLNAVIQPDFMQVICLCAGVFILPLRHPPHWRRRYVLTTLICILLSSMLTMSVWELYDLYDGPSDFLIDLNAASLLQAVIYILGVVIYYMAPLCAAYLLMRLCACMTRQDALYGTACAYAVQHISFCATVILFGADSESTLFALAGGWITALGTAAAGYYLLARRLPMNGEYRVSFRKAVVTMFIIFAIAMLMNIPANWLRESHADLSDYLYPLCMGYDMLSCIFILWSQTEQRRETDLLASIQAEQRLRSQMQEQYEFSKSNIDLVNRKCHDLKHQIAAVRLIRDPDERESELQEIEKAVLIYDSVSRTGNEVLDTVLTEKSLICEQNQISWTCMADGGILQFIPAVDLYTLFGNALDNAIEASCRIDDPERRHIAVTIQARHGSAFIQVENYCVRPPKFLNGLPQTDKDSPGEHGFGVRSIREIAERYGGTMDISVMDDIFLLSVLIPLPQ